MIENVLSCGENPDAGRRCCADCCHLQAAVSWWCVSDEAVEARGTSIPGVRDCVFWQPAKIRKGARQ